MIGSTRNLHVYVHPGAADMRKGYDGLFALTRDAIGQDPLSGHLFLFVARNRKRAKVLFWDGTGLVIYMKRLEQGRFVAVWERESKTLTVSELALFLEGSTALKSTSLSPSCFLPGSLFSTSS